MPKVPNRQADKSSSPKPNQKPRRRAAARGVLAEYQHMDLETRTRVMLGMGYVYGGGKWRKARTRNG